MALKSTIFKTTVQISDMDRNYYADHALTIARHPSETDQRMMLRLLVFCLYASETLAFTKGLSTDDEPDLWVKNDSGEIDLWIDLGLPDEKRIRKACGRSKKVILLTYNQRSFDVWWKQIEIKLQRFNNLSVVHIDDGAMIQLESLVQRTMQLQCSIQDGEVWLSDEATSIHIQPKDL